MISETIMMTVLTHPLHVLVMGIILTGLAREAVSAATRPRRMGCVSHPAPGVDLSETRAA